MVGVARGNGLLDGVFGLKVFDGFEAGPQTDAQLLGTQEDSEVEVVKAEFGRGGGHRLKLSVAPDDQRAERVTCGIGLKIRRETGGDLARIGEDENLASSERRELGGLGRVWGLYLDLPGYQGLEGLIALRLVILNVGASELGGFSAAGAGHKLAARFHAAVDPSSLFFGQLFEMTALRSVNLRTFDKRTLT